MLETIEHAKNKANVFELQVELPIWLRRIDYKELTIRNL